MEVKGRWMKKRFKNRTKINFTQSAPFLNRLTRFASTAEVSAIAHTRLVACRTQMSPLFSLRITSETRSSIEETEKLFHISSTKSYVCFFENEIAYWFPYVWFFYHLSDFSIICQVTNDKRHEWTHSMIWANRLRRILSNESSVRWFERKF